MSLSTYTSIGITLHPYILFCYFLHSLADAEYVWTIAYYARDDTSRSYFKFYKLKTILNFSFFCLK